MTYEKMLSEQKRLESEITSIQTQLQALPEGKLICTRNQQRYKWYRSDGHTYTYIPKSNRSLAEQLATKKYLTALYNDLLKEKKAVDSYLKHYVHSSHEADLLLTKDSGYQELLLPYFKPTSQELSDWMNSPFETNTKYPEQLTHKTISGHHVRSKSESLIDMLLHMNKIPFRYECLLQLGEITLFPDFTIRHPSTGKFYFWEHFGRMDEPAYYKNAFSKLHLYTSYGIVPTIQLITTYETKNNPLNSDSVEKIITDYFL